VPPRGRTRTSRFSKCRGRLGSRPIPQGTFQDIGRAFRVSGASLRSPARWALRGASPLRYRFSAMRRISPAPAATKGANSLDRDIPKFPPGAAGSAGSPRRERSVIEERGGGGSGGHACGFGRGGCVSRPRVTLGISAPRSSAASACGPCGAVPRRRAGPLRAERSESRTWHPVRPSSSKAGTDVAIEILPSRSALRNVLARLGTSEAAAIGTRSAWLAGNAPPRMRKLVESFGIWPAKDRPKTEPSPPSPWETSSKRTRRASRPAWNLRRRGASGDIGGDRAGLHERARGCDRLARRCGPLRGDSSNRPTCAERCDPALAPPGEPSILTLMPVRGAASSGRLCTIEVIQRLMAKLCGSYARALRWRRRTLPALGSGYL